MFTAQKALSPGIPTARTMLRPIGFQSLDEALPVFARGFPAAPRSFWESSLARLKQYGAADPTAGAAISCRRGAAMSESSSAFRALASRTGKATR